MLYTPDGIKPSPEKVRAIESLEPPKDKKELHTFLGMATYMSSFIPNLADHTAPLRNLLKENADFTWNPSHSKAFEKVKALICTTTTLAYYEGRTGGSVARFTNRKNNESRITDIKISFSRITEINK